MSKSLQPIQHYTLAKKQVLGMEMTEYNPATVAFDALEAAKGGAIVHLHMPNHPDPVVVHPHDSLGAVTDLVCEKMPDDDGPHDEADQAAAAPETPPADDAPFPHVASLAQEPEPAKAKRGKKDANPLDF